VFVTRLLPEAALQVVTEACDAEVWPVDVPPSRGDLLQRVRGTEGLLSLLTDRIDAEVMDAAGRLRVISNCAVGVDNVDVAEATRRGIPVGNTPGVLTDATADMTFALLLAAARHVVEGVNYVRDGRWNTWNLQLFLGADLAGATLGLIGFGRIGRAVAQRAQGFGLRVLFHNPVSTPASGAQASDLDTVLRESDFVSLHVPLTEATRHMINRDTLGLMRSTAILVNTARGPIVDHAALLDSLREGRLRAAALDVTEPEPLPADHPLLALDNCIVVPHLGSASSRTREQMANLAAQNLVAGLSGHRLPHCVNPEVYVSKLTPLPK
jgi:glyoxylate reductase